MLDGTVVAVARVCLNVVLCSVFVLSCVCVFPEVAMAGQEVRANTGQAAWPLGDVCTGL